MRRGLNPALKAIVYKARAYGIEVIGLYDGWHGLLNEGSDQTLWLGRPRGAAVGSRRKVPTWAHPGQTHFVHPSRETTSPETVRPKFLANMERLQCR